MTSNIAKPINKFNLKRSILKDIGLIYREGKLKINHLNAYRFAIILLHHNCFMNLIEV